MSIFNKSKNNHDPYLALRFPEFRFFIAVRLLITIAVQIETVVVGWQIYAITKDPLSLGLIGLSEALPAIGVSLYAGHIADLIDRRKIILSTYACLLGTSLFLLYFSIHQQSMVLQYGTLPVYATIFISGLARGFLSPATFAILSQIVPRHAYLNSSSWNSSMWQIGAVTGPALGGILYGFHNATTGYLVVTLLILVSFLLFSFIKPKPLPRAGEKESILHRLLTGIRFVFNNQVILSAISLDLFAVLFGGAVALLPIFAAEILATGPQGLGLLRAAPAMGSAIMGIVLAYRKPMENAGKNMLVAVAGFGVCMILFALSTNLYLSLFLLFLSGAFDNISVVIRATIMQILTPDHMRGRVSAVNSMFIGSSNEIGAFESGVTAKLWGAVPSVLVGGSITLLVVLFTAVKAPALKQLNMKKLSEQA